MVVCKQCRSNAFKAIKKEINSKETQMSKDKKVEEIIKKMETLSKTVESNMVKLEAIGSLNETLHATIEKAPEKMKATYAEMLRDKQDNVTNHLEINKVALKDSMKLALLESQREQNKGSTLILYNCPEKIIREHDQRLAEEKKDVDDFITNGVKIRSMDIKNAHRLGKFNVNRANKPRPLRVTFEDKTAVGKVLRHISNLKEADEKYQRISVQREMNKDEMKQIHQKLAEAREKNKNRQDKSLYYVVRGLPSKLEIKAVPARDEAEETAGQQREEDE